MGERAKYKTQKFARNGCGMGVLIIWWLPACQLIAELPDCTYNLPELLEGFETWEGRGVIVRLLQVARPSWPYSLSESQRATDESQLWKALTVLGLAGTIWRSAWRQGSPPVLGGDERRQPNIIPARGIRDLMLQGVSSLIFWAGSKMDLWARLLTAWAHSPGKPMTGGAFYLF